MGIELFEFGIVTLLAATLWIAAPQLARIVGRAARRERGARAIRPPRAGSGTRDFALFLLGYGIVLLAAGALILRLLKLPDAWALLASGTLLLSPAAVAYADTRRGGGRRSSAARDAVISAAIAGFVAACGYGLLASWQ